MVFPFSCLFVWGLPTLSLVPGLARSAASRPARAAPRRGVFALALASTRGFLPIAYPAFWLLQRIGGCNWAALP